MEVAKRKIYRCNGMEIGTRREVVTMSTHLVVASDEQTTLARVDLVTGERIDFDLLNSFTVH